MLGAAQLIELAGAGAVPGRRFLEQARHRLDAQDPPHRVVQALLRNASRLHLIEQARIDLPPAVRCHVHVDAGHQHVEAIELGAAGDLLLRVPVTDHEAGEVPSAFEHVGQQPMVVVHLDALPAVVRRHHGQRPGLDPGRIAGGVHLAQRALVRQVVELIATGDRSAVTEKMLDGRQHTTWTHELAAAGGALQARYHRVRVGRDQCRVLGVTLIGAAPAHIADHRDRRRKGPVNAGGGDFLGRCLPDPLDQRRIVGCAQPDVMRKHRRTADACVAVHGIDAEQDGYRRMRRGSIRHRRAVERIHQLKPVPGAGAHIVARCRIAAGQDRTELVLAQIVRFDRADIGLDQLADFLLAAHAGDELIDQMSDLRIDCAWQAGCRPLERMNHRRAICCSIRGPIRGPAESRRGRKTDAGEAWQRHPARRRECNRGKRAHWLVLWHQLLP